MKEDSKISLYDHLERLLPYTFRHHYLKLKLYSFDSLQRENNVQGIKVQCKRKLSNQYPAGTV